MRLGTILTFGVLLALVAFTGCTGNDESSGEPTATGNDTAETGSPQASPDSTPSPTTVAINLGEAESAILRQFDYVNKGQFGRQWDELHPAHQAIVTKSAFVTCNDDTNFDFNVEIVESYEEFVAVAELGEVDTAAVTVNIEGNIGAFGLPGETTDTFHEILGDDGEWKWVTTQDTLDAYAAGNCPS